MELNKRFEYERLKKFQILNGAQLKYIAFLSMFIDHFNNVIITPFFLITMAYCQLYLVFFQ